MFVASRAHYGGLMNIDTSFSSAFRPFLLLHSLALDLLVGNATQTKFLRRDILVPLWFIINPTYEEHMIPRGSGQPR